MKLGEWIRRHRVAAGVGSVVALVLSGAIAAQFVVERTTLPSKPSVWFYDMGTDKLFAADADALPPIAAPSNAPPPDAPENWKPSGELLGVRAAVFSCGDCGDAKSRFVHFIEKYTPEARAARVVGDGKSGEGRNMPASEKELRGIDSENPADGLLIAFADPGTPSSKWSWRPKSELDADAIDAEARQHCEEGQTLQPCVPTEP